MKENQYLQEYLSEQSQIQDITLCSGYGKTGKPENFKTLYFHPGEIVAVLGPTGSGKSRLLQDIECGARGNTPTGRRVLYDGEPMRKVRKGPGHGCSKKRMIAQISQNMNFVIDLTVREFLQMHARCWPSANSEEKIERILDLANSLVGERFHMESNVAQLSGGQSRALMIADCALLSPAPIILIDEIENAGINRRQAMELLIGEEKIVFLTTHDPLLALLAQTRLIMGDGGIHTVIRRTEKEEDTLQQLEELDNKMNEMRTVMRSGGRLENISI